MNPFIVVFASILLNLACTRQSPQSHGSPYQRPEDVASPLPVLPPNELETKPDNYTREDVNEVPTDFEDIRLTPSSRLCSDPLFGKNSLEACLKVSPETGSIYDDLQIDFALRRTRSEMEVIKRDLVEQNFILKGEDGQSVSGRLYWESDRSIIFDPDKPLKPDTLYSIGIESKQFDVRRPHSNFRRALRPFVFSFKSPIDHRVDLRINEFSSTKDRGIILDQKDYPKESLRLQGVVHFHDKLKSIKLRRLGSLESQELCKEACERSFAITLESNRLLDLSEGLNTYVIDLTDVQDKSSSHHISFVWGKIAKDPNKTFDKGLYAAIDDASLASIGQMVSDFAKAQFTLDYTDENGRIHESQTLNDLLQIKRKMHSEGVPSECKNIAYQDFSYISDLGPFCGLEATGSVPAVAGMFGSVWFKASADIYVKNLRVVEKVDNLKMDIQNKDGYMNLNLKAREFHGTLRIILNVREAGLRAGIFLPDAIGYFALEADFGMNTYPRSIYAKAKVSQENENLDIKINGIDGFNLRTSINGRDDIPYYFNTKEWHDSIYVNGARVVQGAWGPQAGLINPVLAQAFNSKVWEFKPLIVNGIARDIVQETSANLLNTIVRQLKKGLSLPFPDILPAPLSQMNAVVQGQLSGPMDQKEKYITTRLKGKLSLETPDGIPETPAAQGQDSFLMLSPEGFEVPSPLKGSGIEGPGTLINLDLDMINQALYQAWKQGVLNLSVDRQFIETLEETVVFDPANLRNGKEVLFAEFIPKLLNRRVDRMIGFDSFDRELDIKKDDVVNVVLKPLLPPILKIKSEEVEGELRPRFFLELGDSVLDIRGFRDGVPYTIASIKASLRSESAISFREYSNPYYKQRFSGVGAASIQVLNDVKSLDFAVQSFGGSDSNPFGFNKRKLRKSIEGLVDTLFIPLVNDGLRELPLDTLRSCGIELDIANSQILNLSLGEKTPYLRVKAPLKSYPFYGRCQLQPDLSSPRPPLPEKPPEDKEDEVPPPSEGGTYKLDMDFSKLPFELNQGGKPPEVVKDCQSTLFFESTCAFSEVVYKKDENGVEILDPRGRKIYDYSAVRLHTLVPKSKYNVRIGNGPSVEGKFFDFDAWKGHVSSYPEDIVIEHSIRMSDVTDPLGSFARQYLDLSINSPKASGYIPISLVTYHRILETPYQGAEESTEFFSNLSSLVETPEGFPVMKGSSGLEFLTGHIHIIDCGTLDWCGNDGMWLVIYDAQLLPEDRSLPEEVLSYLQNDIDAIMKGMFSDDSN